MKKHYFAIGWGTPIRYRFTHAINEKEAKLNCYGVIASNMIVHDLGTRKDEAMKKYRKI